MEYNKTDIKSLFKKYHDEFRCAKIDGECFQLTAKKFKLYLEMVCEFSGDEISKDPYLKIGVFNSFYFLLLEGDIEHYKKVMQLYYDNSLKKEITSMPQDSTGRDLALTVHYQHN